MKRQAFSANTGTVEVDTSKRTRQFEPPIRVGPLLVSPTGQLQNALTRPSASNMPGVTRLLPGPVPVRVYFRDGLVTVSDLTRVLAAVERRAIFLFETEAERVPAPLMQLPEIQEYGLVVSPVEPSSLPGIEDPSGVLSRECRLIAALGSCIVYVRDGELQSTMLLRRPLDEIIQAVQHWVSV